MPERNLDFDKVVGRRGTSSLKYDFAVQRGKPKDVLPFWVADMDFKTSSYVEDALEERVKHGIFGYTETGDKYFQAVAGWLKRHHGWDVEQDWLIKTPGVVFALAMAVKAYTQPGDKVLIQQPVYYPFSEVIEDNGRVILSNDLQLGEDNRYHIDFEDFERKVAEGKPKLFLLCSPHNPSSRVFAKEELERMGDICLEHGVVVVSDEIHSDFVFRGKHTVFASIKGEFQKISVTCTAPSKTFNLASMMISNIFIPDEGLRDKFQHQVDAAGISQLSALGLVAAQAAYLHGDEWYEKMLSYVRGNLEYAKQYVAENMPGVKAIDGEGTYLLWLDFRGLGLSPEELDRRIIYDARLWLDSGRIFGKAGEGFQRINVATKRSVLTQCLERVRDICHTPEGPSAPASSR